MKKSTKPKKTKLRKAEDLRERAEKLLLQDPLRIPHDDLPSLVHELQVHQIELDIQNQELREAQAQLEESRNRYYDLYDFAPVGYITMSTSGAIEESNLAGADMLGVARNRLLGKLFQGFVFPDDLFLFLGHRETVLQGKGKALCEVRINAKNQISFCRLESVCTLDGEGNPANIRSALVDVTEMKLAEEALRSANERFSTLAENAPDIISRRDKNLRCTYVNRAVEAHLGFHPAEFTGKTLAEMDRGFPLQLQRVFEEVVSTGMQKSIEFTHETPKGLKAFQVIVFPEKNLEGAVESVLSIGRDITALRKVQRDLEDRVRERTQELEQINLKLVNEMKKRELFENMLRASARKMGEETERRRLLSARLVKLLERDRRGVAMALHDQLGQSLATLKMDMELVQDRIVPGDGQKLLAKALEKAAEMMAFVRNLSHTLRPSALETLGLVATLESLVVELRRSSGPEIIFFQSNIPKTLGADRDLAIYRIAQEALSNALKHASSEHISVNLTRRDKVVCLSVEDDGKGFDQAGMEIRPGGPLGIEIMKERATDLGGNLSIESHSGKGTQVIAEFSIDEIGDEPTP